MWLLNVTHGLMMSMTAMPAMARAALSQRLDLLGIAGKAARHKRGVGCQCFQTDVKRRQFVDTGIFKLLSLVGRGAELALW